MIIRYTSDLVNAPRFCFAFYFGSLNYYFRLSNFGKKPDIFRRIRLNFDNIQLQTYAESVTIKTTATLSQSLDREYLCSFIFLQMVKCYARYYTLDSLYTFAKLNELLNGADSKFQELRRKEIQQQKRLPRIESENRSAQQFRLRNEQRLLRKMSRID